MSFHLRWTEGADATRQQLQKAAEVAAEARKRRGVKKSSRAEGLFKQVEKCVSLLGKNPRHPGLQTHEYDSIENPYRPEEKVFEAYAQDRTPGAYRVFWCYGPGKAEITIIAITPHP